MGRFAALTLCILCVSCRQSAIDNNERLATAGGASRIVVDGDMFRHVAFTRATSTHGAQLHIYIGGDGQAFLARRRIATDPTAQNDLALQLMLRDRTDSLYVARPCYHGTATDAECGPMYWSLRRYSTAVVDSMAVAVSMLVERYADRRITLIGYSGGGVIAMLVARKLSIPITVITIAAPLDVEAWLNQHGYTPLQDSINPAAIDTWPESMQRIHFFGGKDRNVSANLQTEALAGMGNQDQLHIVPEFDHTCCWVEEWPRLLQSIQR